MQKIFSQELRFKDEFGNNYPDWEEKKIGEIVRVNKVIKQLYSESVSNFIIIQKRTAITGRLYH